MPKFLRARPPLDDSEARKIRRLAGARHAPAYWTERARAGRVAQVEGQLRRPGGRVGVNVNHPRFR
jgi:hypothetical protein